MREGDEEATVIAYRVRGNLFVAADGIRGDQSLRHLLTSLIDERESVGRAQLLLLRAHLLPL